jgi:hypothetical protein
LELLISTSKWQSNHEVVVKQLVSNNDWCIAFSLRMQDQSKFNNQPEVVTWKILETRSNVAALNNQLGMKRIHHQFRILNNMCEGFVCSLRSFKCWITCGTGNQLVQTTNVEMRRGSSSKIVCGLQVRICFDSWYPIDWCNNQLKCGYGASLGGALCYINNPTLRLFSHTCLHLSHTRLHTTSDDDQTRWHKKHKQQTNTITMVVELLAPPAAWIWWTHAARGVGGLAHARSNAAVKAIY